jgi:hypothetical protein
MDAMKLAEMVAHRRNIKFDSQQHFRVEGRVNRNALLEKCVEQSFWTLEQSTSRLESQSGQ